MTTFADTWTGVTDLFSDCYSKLHPTRIYRYTVYALRRVLPWTILFLAGMLYGASLTLAIALYWA